MTKEEIAAKHPMISDTKGREVYMPLKHVFLSMDEYAKQQSIAFNNWVEVNYTGNSWIGYYTSKDETRKTPEQLYELFITKTENK